MNTLTRQTVLVTDGLQATTVSAHLYHLLVSVGITERARLARPPRPTRERLQLGNLIGANQTAAILDTQVAHPSSERNNLPVKLVFMSCWNQGTTVFPYKIPQSVYVSVPF